MPRDRAEESRNLFWSTVRIGFCFFWQFWWRTIIFFRCEIFFIYREDIFSEIKYMDDNTEILQMIKDGMYANKYFATHILLVVLHRNSSYHQKFFCSLANITFDVKYINPMGREQPLQLTWECKKEKSPSHVYWCSSIYSDVVTSECTKQILSQISESIESPLNFLVTTPLNFKEAEKLGRFEYISSDKPALSHKTKETELRFEEIVPTPEGKVR